MGITLPSRVRGALSRDEGLLKCLTTVLLSKSYVIASKVESSYDKVESSTVPMSTRAMIVLHVSCE